MKLPKLQQEAYNKLSENWVVATDLPFPWPKSVTLLALKRKGLIERRLDPTIGCVVGAALSMPYRSWPNQWKKVK